jgi:hypothetical protein
MTSVSVGVHRCIFECILTHFLGLIDGSLAKPTKILVLTRTNNDKSTE